MDTAVRNVCWLKPPEPPIFKDTPQKARDGMLNFQRSSPAYNEYAKLCLGKGNETSTVSPQPTSTPSPTTLVSMVTSSPSLTTEFTNISSQQNDTIIRPKPELTDLSSNSGSSNLVFVPVLLTIVLLLGLVIGAFCYIKKKKGSGYHLFLRVQKFLYKDPSTRRSRNVPLYDLQNHESVNYLNNKAEMGEKCGGAQENLNFQQNKADNVQNKADNVQSRNGNQTWDSKKLSKSHNETQNVTKSHKNHEHLKNSKNNIELGEYTKNGQFKANPSYPAATQRSQKRCDDEVIYANSQFEKVAKARSKKAAVEKVPSIRDATPPADVKTQDMYFIDENPYDRVDRMEKSKPVPKKRNKVT